jgi:hypothetical protein
MQKETKKINFVYRDEDVSFYLAGLEFEQRLKQLVHIRRRDRGKGLIDKEGLG